MNVRPAAPADVAAVAAVFASLELSLLGRSTFDEDEVLGWWSSIAYETNTWVVEADGEIVAAAGGELHGGRGSWAGGVRPSHHGRGIGSRLADLAESRLTDEGARRLQAWTLAADTQASELFERRGYGEVRRFWDMAIELGDDLPEPAVRIDTCRAEDVRAFHAALEESFADHWEHRPETLEEWWTRQRRRANFDTSLWFLIRDGDEIAAICRNEERQEGGYVGALGVRRAWRGKGHARALLLHSFREFRRRGHARASLGVDSSNPTGATQLYESVGMHVELETVVWEKMFG